MPKRKGKDIGHNLADDEIKRIKKELEEEYAKAYEQLKSEADAYFEKYNKQIQRKMEKVKAGEMSESDFIKWKKQEMLQNKKYDTLVRSLSQEMTKTNQMARDIVNGHLADVYAQNYNYSAFELCKGTGINLQFDLVDRRTVEKLVKDNKIPLPQASLKTIKDMRWNEQKIRSALLQGVVQGDSMGKIAGRLQSVSGMSEEASLRNARTMVTAAECQGRQDRYEEAEEVYGIQMQKTWIATLDDRTRDAHAELDGVSVDVDEPFVNSIGKIMFPCDPDCPDGENVYNCRCTMVSSIKGFPKDLSRREMGKGIENMSYEEWKQQATERAQETAEKRAEKEYSKEDLEEREIQEVLEEKKDNEVFEREEDLSSVDVEASDFKETELDQSQKEEEWEFTPANTIEEAEQFAKDNFISGGFSLTGSNMSYKNVDLDVANRINDRVGKIYSEYNINGLSSLEAYGKGNKKLYAKESEAPFFCSNFGNVGMNTTIMKSEKVFEKYTKEANEAFDYVLANMDKLSGKQLEIAEAYKIAGRSLVDDSLEGMITHEIGHHISYMTEINNDLSSLRDSGWEEYAKHLSGYANHSYGEYIAESWSAYYKGERDLVQPELAEIFDGLKKQK